MSDKQKDKAAIDVNTLSKEHVEMINQLKEQLLIVFVNRFGGEVIIPADEIDNTSTELFTFAVDNKNNFHFKVIKKTMDEMQLKYEQCGVGWMISDYTNHVSPKFAGKSFNWNDKPLVFDPFETKKEAKIAATKHFTGK